MAMLEREVHALIGWAGAAPTRANRPSSARPATAPRVDYDYDSDDSDEEEARNRAPPQNADADANYDADAEKAAQRTRVKQALQLLCDGWPTRVSGSADNAVNLDPELWVKTAEAAVRVDCMHEAAIALHSYFVCEPPVNQFQCRAYLAQVPLPPSRPPHAACAPRLGAPRARAGALKPLPRAAPRPGHCGARGDRRARPARRRGREAMPARRGLRAAWFGRGAWRCAASSSCG